MKQATQRMFIDYVEIRRGGKMNDHLSSSRVLNRASAVDKRRKPIPGRGEKRTEDVC